MSHFHPWSTQHGWKRQPVVSKPAEADMLLQANIFGYKTLTDLGNALGGQEQKDVNELVKSITDSEAVMKNTFCKKGK